MDRTGTFHALAAELSAASNAGDWARLGQAARALPDKLKSLAAAGALSPAERKALTQLRAAYERAQAACGRAARELSTRMDEMHRNKEGWMAYAIDGRFELNEKTQ